MKFKSLVLTGALATGFLLTGAAAQAQLVYSSGHADIGIDYDSHDDTSFNVRWHVDSGASVAAGEYAPEDLVALFSTVSSSTHSNVLAALGSPTGNVYRGGSGTYQPNLGFGGHLHFHDEFVDDSITLSLLSVTGSGEFTLANSSNIVFLSSYDAGLTNDNNRITFGGIAPDEAEIHAHYAWYFSEEGRYDVTLLWSGEVAGGGTVSGQGTFTMYAGVIPEPGSGLLVLTGAAGMIGLRRWRKLRAA